MNKNAFKIKVKYGIIYSANAKGASVIEIDFSLYNSNLPEVTSFKIFSNQKGDYDENGLYSQRLFGPLRNYECKCGRLKGKQYKDQVCRICGVKCTTSDMRSKTFGQIKLPHGVKIIFPTLKYIGYKLFGKNTFEKILNFDPHIYDNEEYYYYDMNKKKLVLGSELTEKTSANVLKEFKIYTILDLYKLYKYLLEETNIFDELGLSKEVGKYLFLDKVVVTPPDTRPLVKIGPNKHSVNDITRHYVEILKNIKNSFTDEIYAKIENEDQRSIYLAASCQKFQQSVNEIFKVVLERNLGEKESIVRQSLLGKTLEFSGRTVVICGPHVPPYMVSMDERSMSKLLILEIIHYMFEHEMVDVGDVADLMQLLTHGIDNTSINIPKEELKKILEDIRLDARVVVERPPVLFYYNDSTMLLDKPLDAKLDLANEILENQKE